MTKKLERYAKKLAEKQLANKTSFFIALAITILALLPGIPLLLGHIEPSLEKILPQEVEEVKLMNDMRGQFGADMMYLVIQVTGPTTDVRDPAVITYLDLLTSKLQEEEYILQAESLADVIKETNNEVIPASRQKITELMQLHPNTPRYVNEDHSITIIHLRSDTGATAQLIKSTVESIQHTIMTLEAYNPGVKTTLTGFNTIDKATFEVIIKDFSNITGLSFLFMLTFLAIYFRKAKKVFAAVSIIMISLIITLGLVGYLGLTITVVTMVAAAMIMALGISYGINVTYDYYTLREKYDKEESIKKLNTNLIRALIGSSLTTSAGFLALLFGIIPAMKTLGIVLALGIIITLASSILFLPLILYVTDKEEKKTIKKRKKQQVKRK